MNKALKTLKLMTQHFEATVNVERREVTIFGDFRTNNLYKIPPKYDWTEGTLVTQGLIDELVGLEDTVRTMIGDAPEETEGVAWPTDASDT